MSQLSPQDPGSGGDVQAWEMSSLGGWEPGWGAWQMARKCGNLWVPPLDSRPDLPGSVWSPCNWVSTGPSLHATLSPVGVPPLPGASTCLAHMTAPCVMSALGLEWEFLGKATGGGCRALEGTPPPRRSGRRHCAGKGFQGCGGAVVPAPNSSTHSCPKTRPTLRLLSGLGSRQREDGGKQGCRDVGTWGVAIPAAAAGQQV